MSEGRDEVAYALMARKIIEENDPFLVVENCNGNAAVSYGDKITVMAFVDAGEYDYIDSIIFKNGFVFSYDDLNGDFENGNFSHYLSDEAIDKLESCIEATNI